MTRTSQINQIIITSQEGNAKAMNLSNMETAEMTELFS